MAPPLDNTGSIRTRTPRQLKRKRALDKASQKSKRAREKAYLQQLQEELRDAQADITHLNDLIKALQNGSRWAGSHSVDSGLSSAGSGCFGQRETAQNPVSTQPEDWVAPFSNHSLPPNQEYEVDLLKWPSRSPVKVVSENLKSQERDEGSLQVSFLTAKRSYRQIWESNLHPVLQSVRDDQPNDECVLKPQSKRELGQVVINSPDQSISQRQGGHGLIQVSQSLQTEPGLPATLECCCKPKKHKSYSDCFEQTVFYGLIEIHSQPRATPSITVTPELADLLFMRNPENAVSMILYKMLKKPNVEDLTIRCAVYIILYRILRYRFFPSLEAYNDVPEWLHSTEIQDSTPHPLYIDFVQFPQLRNAMVLGLVNIDAIREEFDADFGRHLSINWPNSRRLLVIDGSFNTVLNPEFERHVCALDNWSLDSVFARKYPHIAHLVTIKD